MQLVDDRVRRCAEAAVGVLGHLRRHQLLVERACVDTDSDGLAVLRRHSADGGELLVSLLSVADVSRVDSVLREGSGTFGVLGQQNVTVVVEIADEGYVAPCGVERPADLGDAAAASGR